MPSIQERIDEMNERLVGLEVQMANAKDVRAEERQQREEQRKDFEKRMRKLEAANWKSAGAVAVFVFVLDILFKIYGK